MEDAEVKAGPFSIGGADYAVVFLKKRLSNARDPALAETLAAVEIRGAAGAVFYRKDFPYILEQDHFLWNVSASAQLLPGKTGTGFLIRYLERPAAPPAGAPPVSESWQFFGLVSGKLVLLGKPAPIGEGLAGGPFMGVMMRAANGTVSVLGQPDTIEVRIWTGYFYVFVPLRVDWPHGGLAQGQRCMQMNGGGLKEVGCDMRIEAVRKPLAEEFGFARLFVEAYEGSAEHVVIQKDSRVELLGSRAITTWNENAELNQAVFSDVWLHVRIDDHDGWIHGKEDFSAVGLAAGSPSP